MEAAAASIVSSREAEKLQTILAHITVWQMRLREGDKGREHAAVETSIQGLIYTTRIGKHILEVH